jgi:signal transduction histidine kinase
VAIERQRSQEAIRASERFARGQADVLTRTLDKLTRESDFDRIAEYVLRALTSQLDACSSGVWLVNGTTGLMDFEFALERDLLRSKSDAKLAAINPSLPVDAVYPWPEVFSTGKPVVLDDIREGPDFPWRSHLLSQGIITILIVPMFVAGEAAGVIGIRFQQKREFRAEEIELAQALANQAMLALQLTRLSEKGRRSAVVAERNRLAREVHDTLAQGLTGVIVQLEAAGEAMSQSQPRKASGHLEQASQLARESLQEARRSVRALRPQALEENSLSFALNELLGKMTADSSITAKLAVDGEPRLLPQEWENNLLRIGQEVLTNALRHSQATEFCGRLSFCAREVSLHLRDNGIGFDPEGQHEGFGLQGIRERAEAMAGNLAIQSEKGRGVSISIVLPVDSKGQNYEPIN